MASWTHTTLAGANNTAAKMIEFVISRLSDDFKQTDLVRFVVCNHSRRKKVAWAWVCGVGDAPEVPFCAAQLLTDNVIPEDFGYILFSPIRALYRVDLARDDAR